ncbi:MAG: glycine dehydrogenase, partial [Elusimicrobia bacterium CG_4_8_14_3_um_filter_50_9]
MSYCPHSGKEVSEMLDACGVSGVEDLFADIPADLRAGELALEKGKSEFELMREMEKLAANCPTPGISFTGGG